MTLSNLHGLRNYSGDTHLSFMEDGFTLLEMMFTLFIFTVLLGMAVAGMQPTIARSQSENTLADLRMDLVFSRGEAIKRGGWVGICGSDDGSACNTSYQKGWLVFHDVDRDGLFNNADSILSTTRQKNASLNVTLEEMDASGSGPLIFNYRGYPSRAVVLRASKGEANNAFVQQTTGSIESI